MGDEVLKVVTDKEDFKKLKLVLSVFTHTKSFDFKSDFKDFGFDINLENKSSMYLTNFSKKTSFIIEEKHHFNLILCFILIVLILVLILIFYIHFKFILPKINILVI